MDPASSWVASLVTLYMETPDTPTLVSASNPWLAGSLPQDGVSLETVETALLQGIPALADPPRRPLPA
jgi:hypothetical protein